MLSRQTTKNVFLLYGLILVISLAGSFIFLSGAPISAAGTTLYGIANATLTHSFFQLNSSPSHSHFFFTLITALTAGLLLNTVLLWLCRQLLGSDTDKSLNLKNAFNTTLAITTICMVLLLIFFVYSVPIQAVANGHKWRACLSLTVGSFHLAGIPFYSSFFESGYLESNFVIQLGITAGVTLGNLGIFVLHELFSPLRLRQRLADPSIDWSIVTKVSVFAGVIGVAATSACFYIMERERLLAGKNIMEMAFASVYEMTAARGFGVSLFATSNSSAELLKNLSALFLTGPFSIGGGLTLLLFSAIFFLRAKEQKSADVRAASLLNTTLLIVFTISILIALPAVLVSATSVQEIIPAYTGNSSLIASESTWGSVVIHGALMIVGKLALIAASFSVLSKMKHTNMKQSTSAHAPRTF